MTDHLLFIDTEASGLPKKWNAPYSKVNNWPFLVQVSWLVYNRNGDLLKQENHFIQDHDFKISPSAFEIHQITREYLNEHGEPRHEVMALLAKDMEKYRPLLVGHFIELDFHVVGADFFRSGIENPAKDLPKFCTMLASKNLLKHPQDKFLRLGQLYQLLFQEPLLGQHNALNDVKATAKCFFELTKRGEIDETFIDGQSDLKNKEPLLTRFIGWVVVILILLLLVILFTYRGKT